MNKQDHLHETNRRIERKQLVLNMSFRALNSLSEAQAKQALIKQRIADFEARCDQLQAKLEKGRYST